MTQQQKALAFLRQIGERPCDRFDLIEAALALSVLDRPDIALDPYRDHMDALVSMAREAGPLLTLDQQVKTLRHVLFAQHKYRTADGDDDDPKMANFSHVVDKRQGIPVALSLLYLGLADRLGWTMAGVDIDGLFLLRLTASDGQIYLDPAHAGQSCVLAEILSSDWDEDEEEASHEASHADFDENLIELSPDALTVLSQSDVLLRLSHALKRRLLTKQRLEAAISTLQAMILFAPRREELWRELGYLQAERGHLRSAITALEVVRDLDAEAEPLEQAAEALKELRWRLN